MAGILTFDEAARVVSVDNTDPKLFDVLPQVDSYIQQATGRDWSADITINPTAKAAARCYSPKFLWTVANTRKPWFF